MTFDLGSMDIQDEELPKVRDTDVLPLAMLDYVRTKALEFLVNLDTKLEARRSSLPNDFYTCLKVESRLSRDRVESLRAYAIHKILKMKARETLVEHRFEEWMIYSIKARNKEVYKLCNILKQAVDQVLLPTNLG